MLFGLRRQLSTVVLELDLLVAANGSTVGIPNCVRQDWTVPVTNDHSSSGEYSDFLEGWYITVPVALDRSFPSSTMVST